MQSQSPDCMTDSLAVAASRVLLVLPILQIITSPARQLFTVWTPSYQSVSSMALQILRHVELQIVPMVRELKDQEGSMVCTE